MRKVAIVSPLRTPVGKFGGSLRNVSAAELGSIVIKEIINRNSIDGELIDETTYYIPFWHLPETLCHFCRKEFKDDELVIGQIMEHRGFGVTEQFPIHATCRRKAF